MIAKHYPIPSHVADYLQSYFNKYIFFSLVVCVKVPCMVIKWFFS